MSNEFHVLCWIALIFGSGGFMSSIVALVQLHGKADKRDVHERRHNDP